METDEEYSRFITSNDYKGLLEAANKNLSENQLDRKALEHKAKALLSLGSYNDAYDILTKLAYTNINLRELINIARNLINMDKNYQYYSNLTIESNWYEKKVLEQIEQAEADFLQHNQQFNKKDFNPIQRGEDYFNLQSEANVELHKYLSNQFHEVFLIGHQSFVDHFESFWIVIFSCPLHTKLKYPFSQAHRNGFIYTKEQNYWLPFNLEDHEFETGEDEENQFNVSPLFVAPFPKIDWYLDLKEVTMKHPEADVYYSNSLVSPCLQRMVTLSLDKLASQNKDYFNPMYHNIIDPNMTAVEQDGVYKWTATDFIIEELSIIRFNTMISLQLVMKRLNYKLGKYILENIKSCLPNKKVPKAHIASPISNMSMEDNKELYVVAEEILNIALPILSKITRPAILLPGKLQAVVKAQRIYLKPGEEYEGVWHRDGKHEDIVAVVIYYYRVSKQLIGGDLEFIDKQHIEYFLYEPHNFTTEHAKERTENIPYCRIPVKSGTLVVFSNYQMIYRVLRMTCNGADSNTPDGNASRDFLLFFIVDQCKPLISTKSDLTLSEDRFKVRADMFKEQIKPSGMFVPDNETIFTNGSRSVVQVGWMNDIEDYNFEKKELEKFIGDVGGFKNIELMNHNPPMNRGISWAFDNNV
jgi:hypothetical protein